MSDDERVAAAPDACLDELVPYDAASFERLYEIYASLFPLPDEREPPEAFAAIHALNQDLDVQRRYGPYREIVAAIRRWPGGPVIGGHIFGVTTSPDHVAFGVPASVQAIYTFLHEDYRGSLPMRDIIAYSRAVAARTFGGAATTASQPAPIFFEVNNPLTMTDQEIDEDTRHAGLDPYRRYMFWLRSGFSPVEFPYVQPRLREDAAPVRYLDLFVSNDTVGPIPTRVLLSHLRSFVSISVLKNRDASGDADFHAMEAWLNERDTVSVLSRSHEKIREIARRGRAKRGGAS